MPSKKKAKPRSVASLKREIAALRSTLEGVWAALVDIDSDASSREEAIDAVDNACEIMSADWPDDFEIIDEPSPAAQEQAELEERLNKLAEESGQTEDLGKKAELFRKALAVQLGVDEQYIEQQIEQLSSQDYPQIASTFLWWIGALTAKAPINYRREAERLITALKEFKKSLPRKHGPEESPIISEAMRMREEKRKPYRIIFDLLAQKYGEQMMSKNLTPKILAERVWSRRSRLRRSKKTSGRQGT